MRTRCKVFSVLGAVVVVVAVALVVVFATGTGDSSPTPSPQPTTQRPQGPVVKVKQGDLEGVYKSTRGRGEDSLEYAAFLGVPYAAPPVGSLRFKGPTPHPKWLGVRQAVKAPPVCLQGQNGTVDGSEDCLYLNVFTANLDKTTKLPVYVFIHGGKFMGGSSNPARFGPDYLIKHGVVLVTVQYRLGSLGFLSLDTEEIPGNCGLKDNVAALQWLHDNIAAFGGDPDRVTIGGQSAGSALASWLPLLPQTKGLIHGAILMSGTAFHNWAYTEAHVGVALKLASSLANRAVTDPRDAEQILMNATVADLHRHDVQVADVESALRAPDLPYVPSVERRTPGKEPLLITKDAESYFYDPVAPDVPHLITTTNAEWRFYYYLNNPQLDPKVDEEMLANISRQVPRNLIPFQDTRTLLNLTESNVTYDTIIEEIKEGVRNAVSPSCDLRCTLKTYFDDIWILTDSHRMAVFRANRNNTADTFLFKFTVRTELSPHMSAPENVTEVAVHSDDLPYVFAGPASLLSPEADLVVRRMSTMWANFIKFRNPIPKADPLLPLDWPAMKPNSSNAHFVEIKTDGITLHQAESFSGPMFDFWQDLYKKYRTALP